MRRRTEIYQQALRAAAATTGRARAHVLSATLGLALVGGPACQDHAQDDPCCGFEQGAEQSADTQAEADSGSATDASAGDVMLTDAQPSADAPPVDDAAHDTHEPSVDDAAHDTHEPPVASCLDPEAGTPDWRCCEGHDFDPAVEGCLVCTWETEPGVLCMDCPTPWGAAPDGEEVSYEEWQACCEAVAYGPPGCNPWGPPAPPVWGGQTIDALLGRLATRRALLAA